MFYPAARPRGFDELAYYAEHFDTVEVNSTFYGQPRAEVCRRWTERTPAGFEFSIKLYQKFTHPGMFRRALAASLPDGAADETALAALAQPNRQDIDAFKRGIDPLAGAGRLGALLAQFPASFHCTPATVEYLGSLLRTFSGYRLAIELRHRSWSDRLADTLQLLNAFDAAWVQIDEPKFRFSIRQNQLPNVRGTYYLRLHGRNAAQWWTHERSEDRYNYLYSDDELREFTDTTAAVRELVKKTYVYTNNHYSAKSIANAAMLRKKLGLKVEGEYPAAFVERYPELEAIVAVAGSAPREPSLLRAFRDGS